MPRGSKKKLAESGPIHEQHLQSGIEFLVKYSGSQLIEDIRKGQHFSAAVVSAAIQSLLDFNYKVRHKSTPAVLTLSTKGIVLRDCSPKAAATIDAGSNEPLVKASIDRIAYCTADKRNSRVFGFVARNRINETVELHVCKCANDKEAVQLAYSLNEAFKAAARDFATGQANNSTSGPGGAVLSIDEQPLVWSDYQAFSMTRYSSSTGTAANNSNVAAAAAVAAASSNGAASHEAWVQFS